jgi:thiol:disulfide interchange protein DsbD
MSHASSSDIIYRKNFFIRRPKPAMSRNRAFALRFQAPSPTRRRLPQLALLSAALLTIAYPAGVLGGPKSEVKKIGHVSAQAFADRKAIAPGATFRLAISLKMDEDWCVYWQNPGSSGGSPTVIEWTLPAGFEAKPTQYPAPALKSDKTLKGEAFVLQGEAVLLTAVRVSERAKPGEEAAFTAQVSWLACGPSNVAGRTELSLALPIVATRAEAKSVNKKVFEAARESLPIPTNKAEHLKLSASVDREEVAPGDKFIATLTAEVQAKHHMQSHGPLQEGLIPAVVFVEQTSGLEVGKVEYPKAEERDDKVLGKMSEYSGKIVFKIPVMVEKDADQRPRWIRGVLQSQICTDAGTCYPPQYVAFTIPVRMKGGEKPENPDAFAPPVAASKSPPLGAAETPVAGEEKTAEAAGKQPEVESAAAPPEREGATPATGATQADQNFIVRFQEHLFGLGFAGVMLAAFLGGVVLNLMPCVLPVISLKVLSFVRQAHQDRWRVFRLGLTYGAGIMLFYLALAGLFYGYGTAWGQLFQEPIFVMVMAAIVLAFALSLFGVFTVFAPKVVNELGQQAESQEGYLSAFSTGVLATLLGTACTAPFLSAAIGYATRLPVLAGSLIFVIAGLGMASPFVVLTYNPAWLRFVPKPGPWMQTFEHIMGFLLLATVIWLLNPLRGQVGDYGLLLSLMFLLSVAMAVWVKGKIEFGAPLNRKIKLYAVAVGVLVVGWLLPFRVMSSVSRLVAEQIDEDELTAQGQVCLRQHRIGGGAIVWKADWSKGIPWQHYRREQALEFVNAGYTVFVDYTADWCASCKTNLKTSLDVADTIKVMRDLNVVPFEADYTLKRPDIKKDLQRFNRAGVPLYLVYKPGAPEHPEVLPEILTPGIVIDALKRAGPSRPKSAS